MARIRTIKPEFWEDEIPGTLSLGARLLFIATWNYADDEGLIRWSAEYLKSVAFRYDRNVHADTVQAWMGEIEDAEMVFTYATSRERSRVGFIVNFRRHQRIDKPQGAKLPPPNWRDPVVVAIYARRDGWICPICKDLVGESNSTPDRNSFHWNSENSGGMVAEKIETRSDDPTNIRVVHAHCARVKPQVNTSSDQVLDDFQEPSETDPALFPNPSTTEGIWKGSGRDVEGEGDMDSAPAAKPRGRRPQPQTEAPEDLDIPDAMFDTAFAEYGFDRSRVLLEKKKFLNHHRAKGNQFKDWTAAFRNWLINAKKFDAADTSGRQTSTHQAFRQSDQPKYGRPTRRATS